MLSPNFTPFPELTTDRLLHRQMTLADAPCVLQLRSNEDAMKYINRPLTLTIEDAKRWINMIIETLGKNDGITWRTSCRLDQRRPSTHIPVRK